MDCESTYNDERKRKSLARKKQPLKCILFVSLVLGVAAFGAIVLLTRKGSSTVILPKSESYGKSNIVSEAQAQCEEVCTTTSCLDAASDFLSYLDPTVDPCDDFFAFSCNNWPDNIYFPNDRPTMSQHNRLTSQMRTKMLRTIENVNEDDHQSVSYKRKLLFDSCLKYVRSSETGIDDIRQWFNSIGLSNWPRLDINWSPSSVEFHRLMGSFISVNENPFFRFIARTYGLPERFRNYFETQGRPFPSITPNETVTIIFGVDDDMCTAMDFEEDYRELSITLLSLLGSTVEEANHVFDDAREVHKAMMNVSEYRYEPETELDCTATENALNNRWCILLQQQIVLSNARLNLSTSRIKLSSGTWFAYFDNFFDEFDRRKIVNFLSLKFLLELSDTLRLFRKPFLPKRLIPIRAACWPVRFPFIPDINPEDSCLNWLTSNLHYMLTPDYIKQNEVATHAEKTLEMFKRVRDVASTLVRNATAFGEEARSSIAEVLQKMMVSNFGTSYFAEEFDAEKEFSQFLITEKFISNIIYIKKWKLDESIKNPESNYIDNWKSMHDYVVQAEADPMRTVSVQYGFLQPPVVGYERPQYINYGKLGSILGHETAHNFYNSLLEYGFGDWGPVRDCLIEQYSQYEIPEWKIKSEGGETIVENFADNVGVPLAFKAYKRFLEEIGEEYTLPGSSFSPEQMYFIQFGQIYCEHGGKDEYASYLNDPHSPGHQRVKGTLKNMKDFSETFNCPIGSPMNPEKKCEFKF